MATKSVSAATIALGAAVLLVGSTGQSFPFVHHGTTAHRGSIHHGATPNHGSVIHHRGSAMVGRQDKAHGRGAIVVTPNGGVYYRGGSAAHDASPHQLPFLSPCAFDCG